MDKNNQYERKTFEEFLANIFSLINPGVLDDDLETAFDSWIQNKDTEEIIKLAELYGQQQFLAGKEEALT